MINDVSTRITYRGTGATVAFPVTFPIYEATDVEVYVSVNGVETKKTLNVDYNVAVNANGTGGKVTFVNSSHVPASCTIAILLSLGFTQDLNVSSVAVIDTESMEQELDRQVQLCQMLRDELKRAVKLTSTDLGTPEQLRDTLLLGKREAEQLLLSQAAIDRLHQSIANIDRLYASVGNMDRVAASANNVDVTAGHIANVDSVVANMANVDIAANNISNINSVAGSIASVDSVADNMTDVNTLAPVASELGAFIRQMQLLYAHILEELGLSAVNGVVNQTFYDTYGEH